MSDDEELKDRELEIKRDKVNQAKWYESLNLYTEALRIYTSINDKENEERVRKKMVDGYSRKAVELEKMGRYQDAANLFYLIGDSESVGRMKEMDPNLVILYDEKSGGLAQLAENIYSRAPGDLEDRSFFKPNERDDTRPEPPEVEPHVAEMVIEDGVVKGKNGMKVKMPKGNRSVRFCPYCGESLITKKEPKFCPYCGEEL
ncbi:MAG: hypothetical protein ACMUIG_00020 [Thermoplasmatota archaeon]